MQLAPQDATLFFKLQRSLFCFVNQQLQVIPGEYPTPDDGLRMGPELRVQLREALIANRHLIDDFVKGNPYNLSLDELDIVRSWNHLVAGKFYILRLLQKHAIFFTGDKGSFAFGVLALTQPFEELIGSRLPVLTETHLLPFRDAIVYDGLMCSYNISFGPGIRRSLNDSFKEAKLKHGIITSLPASDGPPVALPAKRKPKSPPKEKPAKDQSAEILQQLVEMTDTFCRSHLNEEYAELCRKLAEKLSRKRPSPLLSGNLKTWACGIVRTIGWVNFLDDRTQTPHLKLTKIDEIFGVAQSTGGAKSAAIRKMLKIHQFDHVWSLPSKIDQNPRAWLIQLNGFIVDARTLDRSIQEEAFRKGLIPYLPKSN